jgi:hypothetical protein
VEFAMSLEVNAITLVVPFPPGGSTDFTARILAERLAEVLERPVDVVTRTGDFGYNAVRALLAGPADSTFLIGNVNSNSVMPVVLRGRAEFDHWQVVQPITRLAEFPSVVCTHMRFPADTLDAFIAHLKCTTGWVRYGTDFLGTFVDVDIIDMCERVGPFAWRGWSWSWQAEPGGHVLSCRATDADGNKQPLEPFWNLQGMGNNYVQTVPVTVR